MISSSRRFAAAAVLSLAASCSPATPPPDTPPPVAVAKGPATAAPPAPDLDAVPEPPRLSGVFRMGSPIREIAAWRDLLPAHTPFGQLASLGAEGLARLVFGSLGEHVDVGAPLDMIVLEGEDGESNIVASVVLRDLGEAQRAAAADFEMAPRADGGLDVKPRRGAKDAGLVAKSKLTCAALRGGAPVADHLVCADGEVHLEAGGPYLARTVARETAGEGLRFEIPESTFRQKMASIQDGDGRDGQGGQSPGDAAAKRMGEQIAKQFLEDFASAAIEARASQAGVVLGTDLRFHSTRSPFTVAMIGTRGQGVPAAFWKLPADADLALHLPGAARDAMRASIGSLWTELAETMPDKDAPRQVWRDLTAKASTLFLTGGPLMVAHGPAAAAAPGKANAPAGDPVKMHRDARTAAAGWLLFAAPEPADAWTRGLREIVKIGNTSTKAKGAAGPTGSLGGATGGAGAKGGDGAKKPARRTRSDIDEVAVRASEKLPAGALHLVDRVRPNPDYKPGPKGEAPLEAPYENHVFVAGTAEHTWVVLSENEALARAKLREAMGEGGGIGARPELEPLRRMPPGGVGFVTIRGLLALREDADTPAELAAAAADREAIAALPSAGTAPMFVSLIPEAGDKGAATLRMGGALSIAAALDVIRWLQR